MNSIELELVMDSNMPLSVQPSDAQLAPAVPVGIDAPATPAATGVPAPAGSPKERKVVMDAKPGPAGLTACGAQAQEQAKDVALDASFPCSVTDEV